MRRVGSWNVDFNSLALDVNRGRGMQSLRRTQRRDVAKGPVGRIPQGDQKPDQIMAVVPLRPALRDRGSGICDCGATRPPGPLRGYCPKGNP